MEAPARLVKAIAAVVEEAGCTPPSLYHYWPRRELLLQEASARGWALFRASQTSAAAAHHDPVERLRLRGRAYLEFALAKPTLFRVLFLEAPTSSSAQTTPQTRPAPTTQPGQQGLPDQRVGETGEGLNDLLSDVSAAMATGAFRPGNPLTVALALWSAMHGVAALWTVTPTLPADLAYAVGDLAPDAVLRGLTA